MSQPDPQGGEPRWTAGSIALLVIGLLILLPAGLCTVLVAVEDSSGPEIIWVILAVGGVPIGAGAALICAALKIRPRDSRRRNLLRLSRKRRAGQESASPSSSLAF